MSASCSAVKRKTKTWNESCIQCGDNRRLYRVIRGKVDDILVLLWIMRASYYARGSQSYIHSIDATIVYCRGTRRTQSPLHIVAPTTRRLLVGPQEKVSCKGQLLRPTSTCTMLCIPLAVQLFQDKFMLPAQACLLPRPDVQGTERMSFTP